MKLDAKTYRILWEAHAWAGALASVLLVGMFLLGVVALFHHELMPWQEPRLRAPVAADDARMLATVQRVLEERAGADAPRRLDFNLPAPHAPWIRVSWWEADGSNPARWVHPETAEQAPERSDLGNFLFLLHFLYPLPQGMLIAGLLATVLLLVVVTGGLLQLGRFGRELVRFRPLEGMRMVWSDLHKVLGSVGLPFQAVIAWTAAIICLNTMVLRPAVVHTAFDGAPGAELAAIGYPLGPRASGQAGPVPDAATVLAQARHSLPEARHYRMSVVNLGDQSAHVDVRGYASEGLSHYTSVRVAGDGQVLHVRQAGGPGATARVLEGAHVLHSGNYGGFGLRVAYALLGLFSALCILTGNLLWLERRARGMRPVDIALARLTAGGCGGAAVGLASIFLANQLLPESLHNRPAWEHAAFYAGWCLSVLGALLHPRPAASAQYLLDLAGGTLALLPLLDAWRHARMVFDPSGSPYVFWVDVGLLVLGAIFLGAARVVRHMARRTQASADALRVRLAA